MALPASRRHGGPKDLARQARRHVRHPLPERLPEDDPGRGGRRPGDGEGDQRRLQPRARDALRARSTRRSARSGTTRASTSSGASATRVILRMEKLGVPTYDELIFVARREDLDAARRLAAAALPPAPRRAGHRLLRDEPGGGRRRAAEGRQGPRPRAAGGGRRGDAAGLLPRGRREAVGLAGAGRVGRLRALDARQRACSRGRRTRHPADQRVPAGRGADPRTIRRTDREQAAPAAMRYRRPGPATRVGREEPAHLVLVGDAPAGARSSARPTSLR